MKRGFGLLILLGVISFHSAFAQEISFAKPAEQLSLNVTISENGHVNVEHMIKPDNVPSEVSLILGKISNISVVNEGGKEVQYATSGDEKKIVIFPSEDVIYVRYDLDNVLSNTDNVWRWDFLYTGIESTIFYFPEKLDLVFANDRPVYIGDHKGMKCHGCQMRLEYVLDEPIYVGHVEWEKEKFDVAIRTLGTVKSLNFDQPNKMLSLGIDGNEKFVTLIIPVKLLGNPYEVTINDQKIFKHEFNNNGTHVWLNVRPETSGEINIVGTTVIPEFPIFIPLVLGILFVIIIQYRSTTNLR